MTAMTQATGLSAGAIAVSAADSSAASSVTSATDVPVWSVVVLLVGLAVAIGWALYARAVRVDRLHRQVLGSRATLEAQLVHRAEAAADLATTRALDPASSLLLSQAAREALDAEGPIVDDGLDTSPRLDVEHGPSDGVASEGSVPPTRSRARAQPPGPGLLPSGPGAQVPQHPRQRGPGSERTAASSGVPPGRPRTHAPDLRRRRRHHPRGAAGPVRPGAAEVNQ